jgi:hypothetical protein
MGGRQSTTLADSPNNGSLAVDVDGAAGDRNRWFAAEEAGARPTDDGHLFILYFTYVPYLI